MGEEEIAAVRRLSGRFQGNVQEEIAAYNAAGDNWMMKTVALWDLIATILNALEAANRDRASVRRDALLEAAKVNCGYCRHGDKPVFKVSWHHADSNGVPFGGCTSNRIYDLLAVDTDERATGQGQGEGVGE
jgi:hypothetical protein